MAFTFIFIISCCSTLVAADLDSQQQMAALSSDFAFNLYRQVASEGGNAFMAPYSIYTALAMTYAGAAGTTRSQMGDVLGLADFVDAPDTLSELTGAVFTQGDNYTVKVANRLFGAESVEFKDTFLETLKSSFNAGLKKLDFATQSAAAIAHINGWVFNQTEGTIEDLISEDGLDSSTILVLVNAIYFNAFWKEQFNADLTKGDVKFHVDNDNTVECDMMAMKSTYSMNTDEELKLRMIELPYEGEAISMYIILPDDIDGLSEIENQLTESKVSELIANLHSDEVRLSLPKFDITHNLELKEALADMGMPDLFDSKVSDLSGMADLPLVVDDVLHQAFVKVNEEGTEASGATAVVVVLKSRPKPPEEFKVDRPFVFFIRHKETGAILFLGRVANPVKTMMTSRMLALTAAAPTHTSVYSLLIATMMYLGAQLL